MADLTPQQDSLVTAFVTAMDARDAKVRGDSQSQFRLFKGLIRAKDIIVAVLFFGTLIGTVVLTFQELRAKPSTTDVTEAIEVRVKPVEDIATKNAETIDNIESDLGKVKTKVDRIEDVQAVIFEQNTYQSKVLDHVANKKRGAPPAKPPELEKAEQALVTK